MKSYIKWIVCGAIPLGLIAACNAATSGGRESRLSAAVTVVSREPAVAPFLRNPGVGYVQAYFRFGPDMPDDVIIAIDQEFVEGLNNPIWVKGGDWMSFVGVQPSGILFVAAGTANTMRGNPSGDRNWQVKDLKTRLRPDTWYLFRVEADFGKRTFKSATIIGPGTNVTADISEYTLDYPNYMPFSDRAMTYFMAAMRGRSMMKTVGVPIVYFDDLEGGVVEPNGTRRPVYSDNFENSGAVQSQPAPGSVISTNSFAPRQWYLERGEAIFSIENVPFARSGTRVGVANASLDN